MTASPRCDPFPAIEITSQMYHISEQYVELQKATGGWWAAAPQGPPGVVEDGFDDGHETCITSR